MFTISFSPLLKPLPVRLTSKTRNLVFFVHSLIETPFIFCFFIPKYLNRTARIFSKLVRNKANKLRIIIIPACTSSEQSPPGSCVCVSMHKTASFRAAATARHMSLPVGRKKEDKKRQVSLSSGSGGMRRASVEEMLKKAQVMQQQEG